jgi:hypothetical protein
MFFFLEFRILVTSCASGKTKMPTVTKSFVGATDY